MKTTAITLDTILSKLSDPEISWASALEFLADISNEVKAADTSFNNIATSAYHTDAGIFYGSAAIGSSCYFVAKWEDGEVENIRTWTSPVSTS